MEIVTEIITGTPIRLKKPFNFDFLNKYGRIVKVVENGEGSGNLCFCIENEKKKYFVKFAGAPKEKFDIGTTEQAAEWLREAAQVYHDLAHKNLIKLIKSEEAGGGYINIFEWTDSECIGYPNPLSRRRFLTLPVDVKLRAFKEILDFHAYVAKKNYVAIDFYSDQILYDFEKDRVTVCDIDFYQKSPYYGDKGTWGSSNFVSPEERVPGSRVDEITMVYTMGAAAFSIFSDYDRSFKKWTLGASMYKVAKRAVSDEREQRQQSIIEFIKEWDTNCA